MIYQAVDKLPWLSILVILSVAKNLVILSS
jgi:hypothetical protein